MRDAQDVDLTSPSDRKEAPVGFKSEFSEDAWTGFAQMFAAAHGMVSKADGHIDDLETDLLFSVVQGKYAAVPADVHRSFDADPALAREVLSDQSAFVHAIAPDDGGAAALRAQGHLSQWLASAPSDEVQNLRGRWLRGLLVEVMYLGLRAGEADGYFDRAEYETWSHVGTAFGLPQEWLDQLQLVASRTR